MMRISHLLSCAYEEDTSWLRRSAAAMSTKVLAFACGGGRKPTYATNQYHTNLGTACGATQTSTQGGVLATVLTDQPASKPSNYFHISISLITTMRRFTHSSKRPCAFLASYMQLILTPPPPMQKRITVITCKEANNDGRHLFNLLDLSHSVIVKFAIHAHHILFPRLPALPTLTLSTPPALGVPTAVKAPVRLFLRGLRQMSGEDCEDDNAG